MTPTSGSAFIYDPATKRRTAYPVHEKATGHCCLVKARDDTLPCLVTAGRTGYTVDDGAPIVNHN